MELANRNGEVGTRDAGSSWHGGTKLVVVAQV